MNVICLNRGCGKKNKCGTYGEKNDIPYQNYGVFQEKECKQIKPKR